MVTLQKQMKGGKKKMEIQGTIYVEKCLFCGKEFKSLYPNQTDYNKNAHQLSCKKNPSVQKQKC